MFAWVLVMAIGMNYSITVPGIVSQAECARLAGEIPVYSITSYKCFRYQIAK